MEAEKIPVLVRKSMLVAHLLWLCLGLVGAHRFYLGKKETAWYMVALLMLTLLGPAKMIIAAVLLTWWLVDGIRLGPMVWQANGEDKTWAG